MISITTSFARAKQKKRKSVHGQVLEVTVKAKVVSYALAEILPGHGQEEIG